MPKPFASRDWLVALARQQHPDKPWLELGLDRCTRATGDIPDSHFVSPRNPNKSGSPWQFADNVTLEHPEYGTLILDVLTEKRIGGVELLDMLIARQ